MVPVLFKKERIAVLFESFLGKIGVISALRKLLRLDQRPLSKVVAKGCFLFHRVFIRRGDDRY